MHTLRVQYFSHTRKSIIYESVDLVFFYSKNYNVIKWLQCIGQNTG